MRKRISPTIIILLAFVVSRILYARIGVRFDMSPLSFYEQILDPRLLRDHLWQSLWYQHSQPPLFNLILGAAMAIAPASLDTALHLFFAAIGLILALVLFRLMKDLGVSNSLSLVLTLIFAVSPSAICYENLAFYTYPTAALLLLAVLFFHRFSASGNAIHGMAAFASLALVMLMRSAYHPILFCALLGGLFLVDRARWRRRAAAAIPAAALVLALFAKNALLFGSFSGSTWFGSTIHAMTTARLPLEERRQLVAERKLSPYALFDDPFTWLGTFRPIGLRAHAPTGVPILDREGRWPGAPNSNNLDYIEVSRAYGDNALYLLRTRPGLYMTSVAKACVIYSSPETNVWEVESNRAAIQPIDRLFNLLQGQVLYTERWIDFAHETPNPLKRFLRSGLVVLIGMPLLIGWSIREMLRRVRSGDRRMASTLAFLLITALYSIAISNLMSISENSRYRFEITPLLIALFGFWLTQRRARHGVVLKPALRASDAESFPSLPTSPIP